MSDLVERLKARANMLEASDMRHANWLGGPTPEMLREAAAELTRLREENLQLRAHGRLPGDAIDAATASLTAQLARIRKAGEPFVEIAREIGPLHDETEVAVSIVTSNKPFLMARFTFPLAALRALALALSDEGQGPVENAAELQTKVQDKADEQPPQ